MNPYAGRCPLSTHLASASDGRSRGANEVYRTLQIRTTRRKRGVIRSDSTARRDSRLAFGLHLPVDPPRRAPRQSRYQAAGFLMLVPGMGFGSCECRNPLALTCREKSACAMSCRDGLPVPGVTNPIRLPRCRRTRPHGCGDVAVVAHHDAAVVGIEPTVIQQMHREIDIRALLLGPDHLNRALVSHRLRQRGTDPCVSENARSTP